MTKGGLLANRLTGKRKCTYLTTAAAGQGAPAFHLTSATWTNFQLHFVEYTVHADSMNFLPASTASPLYLGTMTADTFPNPLKTISSVWNSITWTMPATSNANDNIETITPGSIGNMQYYPYVDGTYKDDLLVTIDSGLIFEAWNRTQAVYDTYNAALDMPVTGYQALKTTYNAQVTAYNARAVDWWTGMTTAPVAVPVRPCAPDRPGAYTGPQFDWTVTAIGSLDAAAKGLNKGKMVC